MKRREFVVGILRGTGAAAISFTPLPVWAQQRVYLTEEQALKLVFPKADRILAEDKELSEAQAVAIEQRLRYRLASRRQRVYRAESSGQTTGYAMIVNEVGKEQFITFIVGINPDFKVRRVALMVFRESRGGEVQDTRFANQFKGKSDKDPIAIGVDVIGITGATLSSRAFCRGVKKALLICETLYKS